MKTLPEICKATVKGLNNLDKDSLIRETRIIICFIIS